MSKISIEIGGRQRDIKFSQGTTILLQDSPIVDMTESERKAFGTQYIIWAGLKTACAIKGERLTKTVPNPEKEGGTIEVAATIEDVFEWVEQIPAAVLEDVINVYVEVNAFKDKLEQPVLTDEEKKKYRSSTYNYRAECYRIACGKLGWTEKELFESSPEAVHYAFEGYFDKEEKRTEVDRLFTFYMLRNNHSKVSKPQDLLRLNIDPKPVYKEMIPGSPEHREWYRKIKERHKLK